jgi:hypothetical protein
VEHPLISEAPGSKAPQAASCIKWQIGKGSLIFHELFIANLHAWHSHALSTLESKTQLN